MIMICILLWMTNECMLASFPAWHIAGESHNLEI